MPDVAPNNAGRLTIARIVILSAIAPMALLVAPALTVQLIAQYGLKPAQAGSYFVFELGGLSLASLPALWWMRRWRPRQIATVAAILFIIGNIASVAADSLAMLCVIRLVTAMAGGALIILCLSAAAASVNSDRVFGYWVSGQLVLGAVGLAILPRLFQSFGLDAFYILLACLMLLALPLALGFQDLPPRHGGTGPARRIGLMIVIMAMVTLASYYIAVGGSWSFMTVIAEQAGVAPLRAADTVATASLFGIAGALFAAGLGGRIPRILIMLTGYVMLAGAMLLLSSNTAAFFLPAACLFKFAWTFALPPILAVIGDRDANGTVMSWSNLVIGSSNAVAPILAGALLASLGATAMLFIEILIAAVSCLLVMTLHLQRRPPAATGD